MLEPESSERQSPPFRKQSSASTSSSPRWLLPLVIGFGLAIAAILVGGALVVISLTETFPVTLVVAGEAREIDTHPDTVAGLLKAANVTLSEGDQVSPALDTPLDTGLIVHVERARNVFLNVDGATTPLWTPLINPAEILASAGVRVDAGDRIVIDGTASHLDQLTQWPVPVSMIEIRHSIEVRVHDEGGTQTLQTTSGTVGEALFDAGITLYLTDTTTPDLNTTLTHDLDVTITRARPVEIIADGGTIETRSRGNTVAAALVDAGVTLVGMDYAVPAEGTALRPGMTIRVIRVREDVEAQQQPLDFETIYQADASIELDTEQVTQQGAAGVQETRVRVRYENGIAVSRSAEETVVVRAPVNRVIGYGTNVVLRTIDTPEGPREYWRKVRMYVTSYHPVAGDNITATGRTLQRGIIGADTRLLPFGSHVYVDGYGVGEVQDTGPRRSSQLWLDLGYTNEDYQGWHAYYDVYWLTPVPAAIDYTLPAS